MKISCTVKLDIDIDDDDEIFTVEETKELIERNIRKTLLDHIRGIEINECEIET